MPDRSPTRRFYAHVQTWRPYTTSYGVLIAITGCFLAAGGAVAPWRVLTLVFAVVMVWIGGHYLADYRDRELDARSKPQRPIPSGRLTERAALTCGVAGFAGFTVLAAVVNRWSLLPAALCMIGMLAYLGKLKSSGAWGNAVRGAVTGSLLFFGAAAGTVDAPHRRGDLVLFALAFALHDCASNMVGTLRDVRGDSVGACRTLAVRSGVRVTTLWAAGLYAVALVLVVTTSLLSTPTRAAMAAQAVAAVLGARAFWIIVRAGTPQAQATALRAHEILVVERVILAAGVLCLAAGTVSGLVVLVAALAVTIWPQAVMRRGYELPDPAG